MRISERIQYLLTYLFHISLILSEDSILHYSLAISIITSVIVGFEYEGARLHQVPNILGFMISSLCLSLLGIYVISEIIAISLTSVSVLLLILFGETDFRRLKNFGPYQVGFKEFRTRVHDNSVSVFYPINKEYYNKVISSQNTPWLRNGDKTMKALAKSLAPNGQVEGHPPLWVLRYLKDVVMDTVFNGKIDEDFKQKPLIPLIYLHGVCSNRTMHSGACRDLASHGYIVFSIDHKDGSSTFVNDRDGTNEVIYDS